MKKAYRIADSERVSVGYSFEQLSVNLSPCDNKISRGFSFAHFPALRVTRRGESAPWVVSSYPNRPLAKHDYDPCQVNKTGLTKINPDAVYAKIPKETWHCNKQGLLLMLSCSWGI